MLPARPVGGFEIWNLIIVFSIIIGKIFSLTRNTTLINIYPTINNYSDKYHTINPLRFVPLLDIIFSKNI